MRHCTLRPVMMLLASCISSQIFSSSTMRSAAHKSYETLGSMTGNIGIFHWALGKKPFTDHLYKTTRMDE